MLTKETRSIPTEVRRAADGARIVGLAVPYGKLSVDLGGFREMFQEGAFGDLAGEDVYAAFNHNADLLLGRTPDTLELVESSDGLSYDIKVPDTTAGRDTVTYLERGDVRGSSFTFSILPDGQKWHESADGELIRTVTAAKLYEVSPVVNPAYSDTSAAKRSLDQYLGRGVDPAVSAAIELRRRRLELEAAL